MVKTPKPFTHHHSLVISNSKLFITQLKHVFCNEYNAFSTHYTVQFKYALHKTKPNNPHFLWSEKGVWCTQHLSPLLGLMPSCNFNIQVQNLPFLTLAPSIMAGQCPPLLPGISWEYHHIFLTPDPQMSWTLP